MPNEYPLVKKWLASPEKMDARINRLKTANECDIFEKNVRERGFPDLAARARRRAVEFRVAAHQVQSEVERDALAALYAYDQILNSMRARKSSASGPWRLVKQRGVIKAVKALLERDADETHYKTLQETGMEDLALEAIVIKHADAFEPATVKLCADRLSDWS